PHERLLPHAPCGVAPAEDLVGLREPQRDAPHVFPRGHNVTLRRATLPATAAKSFSCQSSPCQASPCQASSRQASRPLRPERKRSPARRPIRPIARLAVGDTRESTRPRRASAAT